ncbi:hypothetical protein KY333_04385 [Candidatus Woesearchaeota archaeon]|nr:hypothetical protein [Candidatus Woesearchaeota archaeon]MBW2994173.1 hypothetical protein [Candidatus Woesearchaeota archaeon]
MGEQINIRVIELTEFILSHGALAMQPERGASYRANGPCFKQDFQKGVLGQYEPNTFVAYQKGTMCGQSADGDTLFDKAKGYYGGSGLAVFQIPENAEGLEDAIENGQGWFDKKPLIVQPETSETE